MKRNIISVALLSGLAIASVKADQSVFSSNGNWSAGIGVSTLGIGANVGYKFNESFKVRGVVNYFQFTKKFSDDELSLSAKFRLFTIGLLGDWHVMQNGFRITGGLVYNGNRLNLKGTPSRNLTVNGRTYTPAEIGEANATFDFRKIAPYIGIGYDSCHASKTGLSFTADLGVLFQGKVSGKVNSISGRLKGDAQAVNDVKDDITKTLNKSWIKTYPVIAIGLSYKF